MKPGPFCGIFLCLGVTVAVASQLGDGEPFLKEKSQVEMIEARASGGNASALLEATQLPAKDAFPILEKYIRRNTLGNEDFKPVVQALKNVRDYKSYFEERLASAKRGRRVDTEAFELLQAIGTPDVVAVIAPYVFDFTEGPFRGDMLTECTALTAVDTLAKLNIADAPNNKAKPLRWLSAAEMEAWQKWVIRKGFVPETTRIDIPLKIFSEGEDQTEPKPSK